MGRPGAAASARHACRDPASALRERAARTARDTRDTGDTGAAFAQVARAVNGLAFFNCGNESGASQPHKHTQVLPDIGPIDAVVEPYVRAGLPDGGGAPFRLREWPFRHAVCALPPNLPTEPDAELGRLLHAAYAAAYEAAVGAPLQAAPPSYNFLLTARWLMLIPRRRDAAADGALPLNSAAFTGDVFVRTPEQHRLVRERGWLGVLRDVTIPLSSDDPDADA